MAALSTYYLKQSLGLEKTKVRAAQMQSCILNIVGKLQILWGTGGGRAGGGIP